MDKKIVIAIKVTAIVTTLVLGWNILGWVGLILWGLPIAFVQAICRGYSAPAVYVTFVVAPVMLIGSIFTNLGAGFVVGGIFTPLITWGATAINWQ
jgi:hypothetical protein